MRAGVDHARARKVVRTELAGFRIDAERELQDAHAWIAELLANLFHGRRDHAEVLGDDRQRAEGFCDGLEQLGAWTLHPPSVDRVLSVARYFPVGLETAEVIDANDVIELERRTESLDPPRIAVCSHSFPIVDRVAPELASRAEVVGRHASLNDRAAVGAQLEIVAIR